jgi:hypothetical protein
VVLLNGYKGEVIARFIEIGGIDVVKQTNKQTKKQTNKNKLTPQYNCDIVESGAKHHNPNP